MAKFNEVQKKRRAIVADRKRKIHGDASGKLRQKPQPLSVSGKRKRKLLKKWRREQKEAVDKGLITMQDVEMAVAEGTAQDSSKPRIKFPMKKSSKLRVKPQKNKGKSKKKSQKPVGEASVDSMVE